MQERHQTVNIGSSKSVPVPQRFGVPQGSGPFLFTLYTGPIGAICTRHGIDYQLYADDTQVYINFNITNSNDQKIALKKIEACVEEIPIWIIQHRLMMNDSKTEFIVIISIDNSNKVSVDSINIGKSTPSARNIEPCQTLPHSDCYTSACPGSCFVSVGLL